MARLRLITSLRVWEKVRICRAMLFARLSDSFKLRISILWLVLSFFVAVNDSLIEMFTLWRTKLVTKPLDRTFYSPIPSKPQDMELRERKEITRLVGDCLFIISYPSVYIWRYNPFRALASLIRRLHSSLFSSLLFRPTQFLFLAARSSYLC